MSVMARVLSAAVVLCLLYGVAIAEGAGADPAAPPAPAPAKAADAPFVIAVFGDSQGEGLAQGLRHLLAGNKAYKILNRTKAGSALSQPLDYDWPGVVAKFAASESADVAIMMFGGNDRLPSRVADGPPLPFRSDAWKSLYEDRERAMVSTLTKAGIHVVWCGDPIASDDGYSADMAWLNERFQEALPRDDAEFLSLWTVVADDKGNYVTYGKAHDGTTRKLRGVDGIHFTDEGYIVVADRVMSTVTALKATRHVAAAP